jgi:hypothetical protein
MIRRMLRMQSRSVGGRRRGGWIVFSLSGHSRADEGYRKADEEEERRWGHIWMVLTKVWMTGFGVGFKLEEPPDLKGLN